MLSPLGAPKKDARASILRRQGSARLPDYISTFLRRTTCTTIPPSNRFAARPPGCEGWGDASGSDTAAPRLSVEVTLELLLTSGRPRGVGAPGANACWELVALALNGPGQRGWAMR